MSKKVISALLLVSLAVVAAAAQEEESEPTHSPDYGEYLARGGAVLRVLAKDADGKPLRAKKSTWQDGVLWRRIGEYRHGYTIDFDSEKSMFTCLGKHGGGLEPGVYWMQLQGGIYGNVEREVRLERGRTSDVQVSFPGKLRIVKLQFQDADGKPVEGLSAPPWFTADEPTWQVEETYRAPSNILRDAPGAEPRKPKTRSIGLGNGHFQGSMFQTDGGAVYVAVGTNTAGKIVVPLGKEYFGTDSLTLPGPFEGDEWDAYPVVVTPTEACADWLRTAWIRNPGDPGRKSLVEGSVEFDPNDKGSVREGYTRVVVDLEAPVGYPLTVGFRQFAKAPSPFWVSEDRRTWVWEGVPRKAETRVVVNDGTNTVAHAWIDLPDVAVYRHKVKVERPMLNLLAASPTVAAFRACRLYGEVTPSQYARDPGECLSRRLVPDTQMGILLGGGAWRLVLDDFADEKWEHALRLDEAQRTTLREADVVDAPFPLSGLWFRVVDGEGVGLPWVEASIHTLDEDQLAQKMLATELSLEGRRPKSGDVTAGMSGAVMDEDPSDEELKSILGEDLWKLYPDREQRLRLANNGTWYDPRNRVYGDLEGYFHDREVSLKAGKRYVLYVWAHSRDDLHPDERIIFEAGEFHTDLGVIRANKAKKD